jgi:hypothetical protein
MSGRQYEDSIWGKGVKKYSIVGALIAKKGDKIAFSGASTKFINNVEVIDKLPFCTTIGGFDLCGLMRAQAKNRKVCGTNDSGGPVVKIEPHNKARAVGIITAHGDSGHLCLFTAIDYITNIFHVNIAD